MRYLYSIAMMLIAFTPDGKLAYITNRDSKEVFVMDAIQHKNLKVIKVGNGPHGVLVIPNWFKKNKNNDNIILKHKLKK